MGLCISKSKDDVKENLEELVAQVSENLQAAAGEAIEGVAAEVDAAIDDAVEEIDDAVEEVDNILNEHTLPTGRAVSGVGFAASSQSKSFEKPEMVGWPSARDVQTVPFKGEQIIVKVVEVYDGDTCTVLIPFGNEFIKLRIRVSGVDTPEVALRGEIKETDIGKLEMEAGKHVRDKVSRLIKGKECVVRLDKWDKYGGRVIGAIFLETQKYSTLTEYLLSNRYAKPFFGQKKEEWGEDELNYILSH